MTIDQKIAGFSWAAQRQYRRGCLKNRGEDMVVVVADRMVKGSFQVGIGE